MNLYDRARDIVSSHTVFNFDNPTPASSPPPPPPPLPPSRTPHGQSEPPVSSHLPPESRHMDCSETILPPSSICR
ncbi:hypothetical protein SODALDRAFT_357968 [Sodiomyces alkalinus F11]|uniref:Uncharacterized protein n=1 Tax=Sodiomyces alkalinus (strain CBS 110278 / VKM F-3762 / F11) TaxID=1314773 RepID=A0A3N2PYK2_SODAK|nr:hypothetical protein SODALDRAFT_357968 [Sodiomyces alkalinus F11]ROT39564.1 hypothetical protein SODALDRAFT_357968 [Sodiomyces alkalinus F11]